MIFLPPKFLTYHCSKMSTLKTHAEEKKSILIFLSASKMKEVKILPVAIGLSMSKRLEEKHFQLGLRIRIGNLELNTFIDGQVLLHSG